MQTVRFSYDRYYGYRCSESGDQSGEYVPAAELARVAAQRDALLAALKGLLSDPNGVMEICAARAAIAQARGAT